MVASQLGSSDSVTAEWPVNRPEPPLIAGRGFNTFDRLNHPYVAIINQQFVRRYLSSGNPLGAGVQLGFYNGNDMKPWSHFEVIGIVADSRNQTIATETEPEIYLSSLQVPLEGGSYFLLTSRSAQSIANEVAGRGKEVDSQVEKVRANPLRTLVEAEYQESMQNPSQAPVGRTNPANTRCPMRRQRLLEW
jgi:hypothetical protein